MEPERHTLPERSIECTHCGALKWPEETDGCCCRNGDIDLPVFLDPPDAVKMLFEDRSFLTKIRSYNMVFSFTSLGAAIDESLHVDEDLANQQHGVYTFRVQGAACRRIGSLVPREGHQPAFA